MKPVMNFRVCSRHEPSSWGGFLIYLRLTLAIHTSLRASCQCSFPIQLLPSAYTLACPPESLAALPGSHGPAAVFPFADHNAELASSGLAVGRYQSHPPGWARSPRRLFLCLGTGMRSTSVHLKEDAEIDTSYIYLKQ